MEPSLALTDLSAPAEDDLGPMVSERHGTLTVHLVATSSNCINLARGFPCPPRRLFGDPPPSMLPHTNMIIFTEEKPWTQAQFPMRVYCFPFDDSADFVTRELRASHVHTRHQSIGLLAKRPLTVFHVHGHWEQSGFTPQDFVHLLLRIWPGEAHVINHTESQPH